MASNNDYPNNENILVKVDQNNLIYVDPNSVVDSNGEVQPRGHKQENLVMYANLEADLIPRTTLIADDNLGNTLTQIAKGNLNFLRNASGDGNFDTTWTDAFVPKPIQGQESTYKDGYDVTFGEDQFKDPTAQTFGIDSINIDVKGANFVPQITINFVDVRGKTLFESSENSPYRAFFHLPWPIFYLTVKGYYGKAIRYRLHMIDFKSRFNDSNGNFEITTKFVGSTFAWLNDIPLSAIINCPYMFLVEEKDNTKFNQNTGLYETTVKQSSRGYSILKSVYRQYEQKGLIPKGFPVRTLKEIGYIAESLDKILEQQIFSKVSMDVFSGIKEMDTLLNDFENSIKAWGKQYLSQEYTSFTKTSTNNETVSDLWFYLNAKDKTETKHILGNGAGALELLLTSFNTAMGKTKLLTQELYNNNVLINKTSGDFKRISIRNVKNISSYYKVLNDKKVVVYIDGIFEDIFQIRKSFEEQRKKVEDDVEREMNKVIKSNEYGFGFEPTVRNMFAVLLANAEVFIRLMKDVHNKAFEAANNRKKTLTNLSKESKGENIYPWPEVKKPQGGGKQNVIAYPGDEELVHKLKSYDKTLWPEVDFIEEYIKIVTNRVETNVNNEPTRNDVNYVFDSNTENQKIEDLSGIDVINESIPFIDKSYAAFVYELYERALYTTLFDSFNDQMIIQLANEEFKNIQELIKDDNDIIELAKTITNKNKLIAPVTKTNLLENGVIQKNEDGTPKTTTVYNGYLPGLSPFERFNYFKDHLPTTNYISNVIEEPFKFEKYDESATNPTGDLKEDDLNKILIDYEPEAYRTDIYPFNSTTYLNYLGKTNFTRDNFKFNGILKVNSSQGFICSPIEINSWLKTGYNDVSKLLSGEVDMFTNTLSVSGNTTSILNTPYFHNQLFNDFNKSTPQGKYVGSSYLLLNSLPFIDLDEEITFEDKKILTSSLFREVSSTHFIPYHLILKWGSIYHRYKTHLIDGYDILNGCINSSYLTRPLSGKTLFDNNGVLISETLTNASSSGTTINVTSTVNLQTGMTVTVIAGTGQTAPNTYITNITSTTGFTISQTPLTGLTGATVLAVSDEYVTFDVIPKISTSSGSTSGVTYTGFTNVGIRPFYQTVYSQIVNDYATYDITLGNVSYSSTSTSDKLLHRVTQKSGMNYWDVVMDNSKYVSSDKNYTLLPSLGGHKNSEISDSNTFTLAEELTFKTLWYLNDNLSTSFSGQTFPSPYDYFRTTGNTYSISTNYKKALDLIGTFSPQILEYFESFFIDFASEKMNEEIPYAIFRNLNYSKFQDILKKLSVVEKKDDDSNDIDLLIGNTLKERQKKNAQSITTDILNTTNLIKFTLANPKEIDANSLYGLTAVDPYRALTTYKPQPFSAADLTTPNLNFIKLYIGEDIDSYYVNFFSLLDIKLTEDNIKKHRPLAQIYGGYREAGGTNTKAAFLTYLQDSIILKSTGETNTPKGAEARLALYLNTLLPLLGGLTSNATGNPAASIDMFRGYNSTQTKLELYNTFKSFNDKWTAGNSIGQRLLLEEFLFLDKANRDIGDKFYLNIDKFTPLLNPNNSKLPLYNAISMIIQGTGLDMRALPAYINFYGNNLTNKNKITPSKKVASNLFGTFLEVDYQEATPKVIIQLAGQTSKRIDMSNSKPYKFVDDSFYIGGQTPNPLLITSLESFSQNDLSKSNRVVAFEVSFGDQNQGIFKGVTLDQSTLKNTSESFEVLENLSRSASGAGVHNVDVSLFDYYKQASYKCGVTAMGNVMIQPTMYFYLKNIPMFRGSYWITEVSHQIKGNSISTSFSGTRIPYSSLPDPRDSFVASYRVLFDKIQSKAIAKIKQRAANDTDTDQTVIYQGIPYVTDRQGKNIQGETVIQEVGINRFGVPYNGYNETRLIQKVRNGNEEWFRTIVYRMGGAKYPIEDTQGFNLTNGIQWSDVKDSNYRFFNVDFQLSRTITNDVIKTAKTTFKNPKNNVQLTVNPNYQLDKTVGSIIVEGPISRGPKSTQIGMGMSSKLMSDLGLYDGDVVYFKMD